MWDDAAEDEILERLKAELRSDIVGPAMPLPVRRPTPRPRLNGQKLICIVHTVRAVKKMDNLILPEKLACRAGQ